MTRTKPLTLVLLAVLGGTLAWFLETALVATGNAVVIPPLTLSFALALIGAIVIVMALPVRRVARRVEGARVDPFYATRVVMLAKASSLSGALLGGAGLAIAAYLLTRSVVPGIGSITLAFAAAVGAVVLLVCGLVAEHMCAIPPDDEDPREGRPNPGGLS
ncbi:uncharacterized membrane protein (UPF0136 family) [Microbacteriaceae bacterium SG_E_30_P1]|uniref:Uncharacterized membrane protein (UPF0136 family) n=1 Tax=Antiquaquibacter oligotrophicus TaxID=2880260 RepID=A0ABT6KKW4_9MICO|nr:DUF3180 family protein [Antiquaquibacter oligotrophicus]MDH6179829.1 uncharacterized membrane protein (UPF0136 family) [Antiquaquibacter oligotrophicus]UDF14409.1 DUF3180 domain-containing protein [Antiquaquibacter oligotrophicus]